MDAPSSRRLNEDAETGLKPGHLLGPYQILEPIGAGGMGRVYRARDPKLNRDVALKILPDAFAKDPDRLARFRREAQVLASLNHPNIGHIYGLEDAAPPLALVLELVEGPTLADLIASRGRSAPAVEIHDVLNIGRQVAEALEAAHEQGVVHRDLKPANVKVRPDGLVKVLDFGLARAFDPAPASIAEAMESPTMTGPGPMTDSGVILGTAPYMSPEQARGRTVDKRADIWAFGCVLFEMLTGRRPFAGETTSDTIAAILTRDPNWTALPSATPARLRALLQRCLEKDAKRRLRDIGEARIEIEHLISESEKIGTARSYRRLLRWVLPVAGLLLLAGVIVAWSLWRPGAFGPLQYTQITDFADSVTAPSFSPDGRMLAFIRGGAYFPRETTGQVYVKLLPNGDAVPLTEDSKPKYAPVFTPDGSRVAYSVIDGESFDTWTVPVLGGQPARMLPNASGLTWMPDGRLLFSEKKTGLHMGIVSATEARADSREIYFPEHQRAMAHYSYASPDAKWVLIVEMGPGGAFRQPCRLVPFDGRSLGRTVGPPGACQSAAWSPDGRWMYFGAVVDGRSHLWRQAFPNGSPEQITFDPTEEEGIAFAPDGKSLVTSVGEGRSTIWIREEPGERQLTFEGSAGLPSISKDGRRAFYQQGTELLQVDLALGKSSNLLPGLSVTGFGYEVSPDETEVAFVRGRGTAEQEIWLAPLDRRSPPRLVTRGGDSVSFGPNGTLIFRKRDGNENYLYRINTDGSGRERISNTPILNKSAVSPDREWVLVNRTTVAEDGAGRTAGIETVVIPVRGGAPRRLCAFNCLPNTRWSPDSRWMSLGLERGRTLVLPVPPGQVLPNIPPSGISSPADGPTMPGGRVVGPAPFVGLISESSYVFLKTELRRNLFRIQLR